MQLRKSHILSAALAILLAGATATAWYYASQARTPEQLAQETEAPDDSIITVEVESGQLLDEFTISGTATRTGDIDVIAQPDMAEGDVAITSKIPLEVGDEVNNGTVLMEISGRPLIALNGAIPAYRDLVEGESEGPDVKQLQQALAYLYGTPVTGTFDARTAHDVRQLYDARGYTAPTRPAGGMPELGDGVGEDNPAAPGNVLVLPAGEVTFVPEFPIQVGSIEADLAAPLPEGGTVMVLVGGTWQIEAQLNDEDRQNLLSVGEDAELIYGSGPLDGVEVPGFEIEEREEEEPNEWGETGGSSNVAVFEFDSEEFDSLTPGDSQAVRVIRARSEEDSLIVPLSAVWTDTSGTTKVTVRNGGEPDRDVAVNVTLQHEGTGVIELVDGDLSAGDSVIVAFRDRGN
ncbi:hypothetical protein [Natronoglycomyces albus]|uniref:Uncharacterized protein n=1 Tax=Natronoglycomyces albus TaxID=2811108 RepID=A0A895XFU8_9ACTN|nr:hypothetical protein [Natronoglycomyces albus]QSB04731.1 hypothetical protein JQS30_13270 [Natronoglycomyces albus]